MCTFNGMKIGTVKPWQENFTEEYNDDGRLTLLSKETYRHEEEGLAFDYRYVIQAVDMCRAAAESGTIYIDLYLVPEPKDWCEDSLKKAAVTYGWEKEPREEILKQMRPQDGIENGYGVLVGRDEVGYDPEEHDEGFYDVLENEDALKTINAAASAVQFYDNTRGFVLDKFQNRIGTTGWDTLNECLNGKDKIQAGLERIKELQSKGGE